MFYKIITRRNGQPSKSQLEHKLTEKAFCSGWKLTNLTSVFTLWTSIFLASWYYAEGINTDIKYGGSWMLDGLVSSHPAFWKSLSHNRVEEI
jgi:hypothetical protein